MPSIEHEPVVVPPFAVGWLPIPFFLNLPGQVPFAGIAGVVTGFLELVGKGHLIITQGMGTRLDAGATGIATGEKLARDGVHRAVLVKNCSQRTPSVAMRSMFGVWTSWPP